MKHILLLSVAIILGTAADAQMGNPGGHFFNKWDTNEDGQVTLIEATERRRDIFMTFDKDYDGFLSASDYTLFNKVRANEQAAMKEVGQGKDRREGQGAVRQGMTMDFNDVNGDGQVSRDEFMTRTKDWYEQVDRNGDGTLTTADFGRNTG